MIVMAASDEAECRAMLSTAFHHDGPAAVRYPRGAAAASHAASGSDATLAPLALGKGVVLRETTRSAGAEPRVAILAFGSMVAPALAAGERARRDRRQHALRQAARRRTAAPSSRSVTNSS